MLFRHYVTSKPNKAGQRIADRFGMDPNSLVYFVEEGSDEFTEDMTKGEGLDNLPTVKEYLMDNFTAEERATMETPNYFYSVTFEKPGGLVMPIIVEYTYKDGSTKTETYPAQIWRLNDKEVSKAIASDKEIVSIQVDPNLETADVDTSNNTWPKEIKQSKFDEFKDKVKD